MQKVFLIKAANYILLYKSIIYITVKKSREMTFELSTNVHGFELTINK